MAVDIAFTAECQDDDCEGTARQVTRFLDIGPDDPIEIDIDFSISQLVLRCDECGLRHYTGDIEILNENDL